MALVDDLKIGNWVFLNGQERKVTDIVDKKNFVLDDEIIYGSEYLLEAFPISLKCLLNYGFSKIYQAKDETLIIYSKSNTKFSVHFEVWYFPKKGTYSCSRIGDEPRDIEFVHELQNRYKEATSEDL